MGMSAYRGMLCKIIVFFFFSLHSKVALIHEGELIKHELLSQVQYVFLCVYGCFLNKAIS